jgi:hypothetical protein
LSNSLRYLTGKIFKDPGIILQEQGISAATAKP